MLVPLYAFVVLLAWFHTSEFALAAHFNWASASWNSWLFSWPYTAAMLLSLVEYALEHTLCPWVELPWVSWCGIAMALAGDAVRKAGILTAGCNFTHKVAFQRRQDHILVTSGIYRWVRHPGYLGWVVWAMGTQLVLCNPLCTALFAIVSWRFMGNRIEVEDRLLLKFFGEEWERWRQKVPSGLPGIP